MEQVQTISFNDAEVNLTRNIQMVLDGARAVIAEKDKEIAELKKQLSEKE